MAKRLTEKNSIENKRYMLNSEDNTVCVTNARLTNCATIAYCWGKPIDKLAQFEDTLEKYDIESIEQLDYYLYVFQIIRKEYGKLNQENCKNKKERDIWQKACELAYKDYLDLYCVNCCDGYPVACYDCNAKNGKDFYYYYEKAKKELTNE